MIEYLEINAIALLALLISGISISISIYGVVRDRAKLISKSIFTPNYDLVCEDYIIQIEAVNAGRRPIVLVAVVLQLDDHKKLPVPLEPAVKLNENEKFRIPTPDLHTMLEGGPGEPRVVNAWFKDTLGQLYKIRDAEQNLVKFYASAETFPPIDFRMQKKKL